MTKDSIRPEGLSNQQFDLKEIIDYQNSAVVSREIVNKKGGTVTVFAFDQGQGLSEHIAPFDALAYIIDGQAEVTISKISYPLKAGEMIIMPAHKPHALKALQKFKMLLVMIK
jgi:quercetin dioxygenase-like cupin family protein